MYKLTEADIIWNRACGDDAVRFLPGDRALSDMLYAHGLAMNGGVLHAVECLTANELSDAEAAYRYYGLDAVATLLTRARTLLEARAHLAWHEPQLDRQYVEMIPTDSELSKRFEKDLESNPTSYAPIVA